MTKETVVNIDATGAQPGIENEIEAALLKANSVEFVGEDGSTYRTYKAADGSTRAKRVTYGWDSGDHEVADSKTLDIQKAVELKHPNSKTTMPLLKGCDLSLSKKSIEDSVGTIMGAAWATVKDEVNLNGLVPVLDAVGIVVGLAREETGKFGPELRLVFICNRPPSTEVAVEGETPETRLGRVV